MVATSWLIAVYYNVVIAHVMMYLFASFAAIPSGLPWVDCNNWWNSDDCITPQYTSSGNGTNFTDTNFTDFTSTTMSLLDSAESFINTTGEKKEAGSDDCIA